MGVQSDLRELGIELRPSHREFADVQEHKALELLRELLMTMENDARLMLGELEALERQGRPGQRVVARDLQRQKTYIKTLRRIIKIMDSAEARRARTE